MKNLLYNPKNEHDACGTGFVVDMSGLKSHHILEKGLEAIANLAHRGGSSADGKSGDGAGILTQIPDRLFQKHMRAHGISPIKEGDYAVGMVFLPQGQEKGENLTGNCVSLIEEEIAKHDLRMLCWRDVPVEKACLGQKASLTCPAIKQVLLCRNGIPQDGCEFEKKLYVLRKDIEGEIASRGIRSFYISSLSHRTIVYKGLLSAPQLSEFYLDLQDPDFETALAVFHQRYSTNTFPTWHLAQPFRTLGHNGEINTLRGNENWLRAWETQLESQPTKDDPEGLLPILAEDGSDSAKLDNITELLALSGRGILHSLMMLIPEAWEKIPDLEDGLRAFYEYHETMFDPWDGPAAIVFSDGIVVGAKLDRNGLRPSRYTITADGLVILASEAGIVTVPPEDVIEKGRLRPGEMIAVDVVRKTLLRNEDIKGLISHKNTYRSWLLKHKRSVPDWLSHYEGYVQDNISNDLIEQQVAFGYGKEDERRFFLPMSTRSQNAVGSMGDDTPLSAFSHQARMLSTYFKQKFAQVTNPPIDSLREDMVMSLRVKVGHRGNFLEEKEEHAGFISFASPILSNRELQWLTDLDDLKYESQKLKAYFEIKHGKDGLALGLEKLLEAATQAVKSGISVLVLSDRSLDTSMAPIPMLLAVSAVHHHLIRFGLRMRVSLICETGEARDEHHIACLIGYGAVCVNPYLAYESIENLVANKRIENINVQGAIRNYMKSLENGLLKIMAKMGISTISSYHGAQLFDAVGLNSEVINRYFPGTESRIGGVGLTDIAGDILSLHRSAFNHTSSLPDYGIYRFRKQGETHAYNPEMLRPLQKAVKQTDDNATYREFSEIVNNRRPINLRDFLELRSFRSPIHVDQVESVNSIVKRFSTTAMSLGALSEEAHRTLAIAMNRLGGKSNSGEGGEDPSRYILNALMIETNFDVRLNDSANSSIKQVASARFGVTPAYLQAAHELEIKMAQGAKPGEGGQLPGHKVTADIARIRHATSGTTLISPPPHHDIYSIEDLSQLIYDLKTANARARVSVKLVAEAGVGTVAAGVAKAYADGIHISGHDGGTGASPLSSIKNTGLPWELGLAEAQQVLVLNDLRGRVYLRIDGGLKTGRDVLVAALLGADEFGFGTSALVAMGCVMARQCHQDTCPVGIATQREDLRARFKGKPDLVVNYMFHVAREVRELLSKLGYSTLNEVVGRSDLLQMKKRVHLEKATKLDLSMILANPDPSNTVHRKRIQGNNQTDIKHLDDGILRRVLVSVRNRQSIKIDLKIENTHRAVGTRIAGEIAKLFGDRGLPQGSVDIKYTGSAGQSFGAFCVEGVKLSLEGEANDYVGKGMGGGEIVIYPPQVSNFESHKNVILGNAALYGATGGSLYAAGQAGERFCVRNSGAVAVVEGIGNHGCEYMTMGTVVILGEIGLNFGAGMMGGKVFVMDETNEFHCRYNLDSVIVADLNSNFETAELKKMIRRHARATKSRRAQDILENWEKYRSHIKIVRPRIHSESMALEGKLVVGL